MSVFQYLSYVSIVNRFKILGIIHNTGMLFTLEPSSFTYFSHSQKTLPSPLSVSNNIASITLNLIIYSPRDGLHTQTYLNFVLTKNPYVKFICLKKAISHRTESTARSKSLFKGLVDSKSRL